VRYTKIAKEIRIIAPATKTAIITLWAESGKPLLADAYEFAGKPKYRRAIKDKVFRIE
jgi:hypothetical protein